MLYVIFLYTKIETLYVTRFFINVLKLAFVYKKHDMLRYVTFYTQKPETSQKARQFLLRFCLQKSWHFVIANFSYNFWNCRRWGEINICKIQSALRYALYAKDNALWVTFLFTKSHALCVQLLFVKQQCTLRYVFISKIDNILLIPNYEYTYDQSDHIDR